MSAKCSSCGAEIIWAISDNGNRMPLDAKVEKRFTLTFGDSSDPEWNPPVAHLANTYISHFATCPNAAQHRKSK
jgi:hypothetical protein